jgi:hypothetical protein
LGPATGIIGTSAPGEGFSLTLRGYDTEEDLLFEGSAENITIVEGDTILVEIELYLAREIPELGDAVDSSDSVSDTGSSADIEADTGTETLGDASSESDPDASSNPSEDDSGDTESDADETPS